MYTVGSKKINDINKILDVMTYLIIGGLFNTYSQDTRDITSLINVYSKDYSVNVPVAVEILSHVLELDQISNEPILRLPSIDVPSNIMLEIRDFLLAYEPIISRLRKEQIKHIVVTIGNSEYLYALDSNLIITIPS